MYPPPLPGKSWFKKLKDGYNKVAIKASNAIDRVYKSASKKIERRPSLNNFNKKAEAKLKGLNDSVAKKLPAKRNRVSFIVEPDPTPTVDETPVPEEINILDAKPLPDLTHIPEAKPMQAATPTAEATDMPV